MVKNTGAQTNETAFWERFSRTYGAEKTERDKPLFEEFYADDFQRASVFCPRNDKAAENGRKASTARLPRRARHKSDFPEHRNLRPHPLGRARAGGFRVCNDLRKFRILQAESRLLPGAAQRVRLSPEECLMVGNDAQEDMIAETTGMKVFLLTDCPYQPGRRGHLRLVERRL